MLFSDFEYEILDIDKNDIGNFLFLKICVRKDFKFVVVVLYGLNKDKPEFYENIKDKLSRKENIPSNLCGDWNLVHNFTTDTHGYIRENNTKAKQRVQEMQHALELEDI